MLDAALIHVLSPGLLLQVRLLEAQGLGEHAATLLLELQTSACEPALRREIELCRAWLIHVRGGFVALETRARGLSQEEIPPLSRARRELLARLRIAQGQPEEAVLLLDPLLQEARRTRRQRSVLRQQAVFALAELARGKSVRAKERLLVFTTG